MRFCSGAGIFLCALPLAIHAQTIPSEAFPQIIPDLSVFKLAVSEHLRYQVRNETLLQAADFNYRSHKKQKPWRQISLSGHPSIHSLWFSDDESGEESLKLYRKVSFSKPYTEFSVLENLSRAMPSGQVSLTASYTPESGYITLELGGRKLRVDIDKSIAPLFLTEEQSLPVLMQTAVLRQITGAVSCFPLPGIGHEKFCDEGSLFWTDNQAIYSPYTSWSVTASPVILSSNNQSLSLFLDQGYILTLTSDSSYPSTISLSPIEQPWAGEPVDSGEGQSTKGGSNNSKTESNTSTRHPAPFYPVSYKRGMGLGGSGDPRKPNRGGYGKREPKDKPYFPKDEQKEEKATDIDITPAETPLLPRTQTDAPPLAEWRKQHTGHPPPKAGRKANKDQKKSEKDQRKQQESAKQRERERRMRELDEQDRKRARKRVQNPKSKR